MQPDKDHPRCQCDPTARSLSCGARCRTSCVVSDVDLNTDLSGLDLLRNIRAEPIRPGQKWFSSSGFGAFPERRFHAVPPRTFDYISETVRHRQ